ncbi:MAG: indolepyruvate oxidoreductase subunit beta [Clostridiales bacterium]|jgi:indolepyruvate ferredoxin oxidoreductase beta subunit|nr:indolepyruvate oxidoreductase subunit beta [Clostridiales bacterium]
MLNIMIVGVGGQGSLLASRILGSLFEAAGLEVKLSEVHGMAQRGGSVVTYIRAGESVASPLIPKGECDCIISFEESEALRYLPWLKKDGTVVVNTQHIQPMPVLTGAAKYPEDIRGQFAAMNVNVVAFDALGAAVEAGNARCANVALLGAASKVIGRTPDEWHAAMRKTIKPALLDLNFKAFEMGLKAG